MDGGVFEQSQIMTTVSRTTLDSSVADQSPATSRLMEGQKIHVAVPPSKGGIKAFENTYMLRARQSPSAPRWTSKDGLLLSLFRPTSTNLSRQANLVALTQTCRAPSGSIHRELTKELCPLSQYGRWIL